MLMHVEMMTSRARGSRLPGLGRALALVALSLSTSVLPTALARDVVTFDYAWRFRMEPVPAPPSPPPPAPPRHQCPPFNQTAGATCSGLLAKPQGNQTREACVRACCVDPHCYVWQYWVGAGAPPVGGQKCWTGQCKDTLHGRSSVWASGAVPAPPRSPPPPPPPPPGVCAECEPGVNDTAWEFVDLPHDFIVTLNVRNSSKPGEADGYMPRANAVYRKHFFVPGSWRGSRVTLKFEGVYRIATVYLNGVLLTSYGGSNPGQQGGASGAAYTQFEARLDNVSALRWGRSDAGGGAEANVLAVYVDGSYGTEHWYAGAGIYRSVWLVRSSLVHIDPLGVYAPAVVDGPVASAGAPLTANASFKPAVSVVNDDVKSADVVVAVRVVESGPGGREVVAVSSAPVTVPAGASVSVALPAAPVPGARLWSVRSPSTYTLQATLAPPPLGGDEAAAPPLFDTVNTTVGVRTVDWRINSGFWLNNESVKLRGFCHHDDFTGVGMAVPDRVWLLRAMFNRGLGGNAWRMSHNNYRPAVYDLADALGLLVWDENRDLRASGLEAMSKMIREHRNHPSVVVWSLCNEGECDTGFDPKTHSRLGNATLYEQFRNLTKNLDPYRAVSGNMFAEFGPGTLTDFIDIQGISHPVASEIAGIRALAVQKPLIASECCSCQSQRGENTGNVPPDHHGPPPDLPNEHFSAFNAQCLQQQVNLTDSLPYVAGSMIWTLGDYIGEPAPIYWPHVSSSFGAIDLAGFPKASARWFEAWWLQTRTPQSAASRPPLPAADVVHIVETNQPAQSAAGNVTIHAYTSASTVELEHNGHAVGARQPNDQWMGWLEWNLTATPVGNLTAIARNAAGAVVATHTRVTAGVASAIALSVDAPSPRTATGERVVLDGHDVALVRATVVDAEGRPVPSGAHNVSFGVVSGPGRVLGVGNGDPSCIEPHQAPWRTTFNGLARAIVKATVDAATRADARALARAVDAETGKSTVRVADPSAPFAPEPIVVTATAPGLAPGKLVVPVSVDAAADGVVATARNSLTMPVALD